MNYKNEIIEKLKKRIKEKNYKMTNQRQVILEVFIESEDKHLSAEDVYTAVTEHHPEIGLATIYRTLDVFTELELLKRLDFGDGRARYELCDAELVHFHHHLICKKCGLVEEFEDDMLDSLEYILDKRMNFKTIDHELKVYGVCGTCQGPEAEESKK